MCMPQVVTNANITQIIAVFVVCNGQSAGASPVCRRAGRENGDTEAAGEADAAALGQVQPALQRELVRAVIKAAVHVL